uniref:uncharacterized protein LOC100182170 isoform X2 n=1 Tax=Ciona intestinalis TaxID=7719 RepID=UPI000EF51F30|nr:uncharacterized protein LOC100182170 isoform X2 [Ciona intestinalis]|eukprot:XP_026693246.1 uncharacterized protein LOC100182170 isoform X2 [Ciona intestinalis]
MTKQASRRKHDHLLPGRDPDEFIVMDVSHIPDKSSTRNKKLSVQKMSECILKALTPHFNVLSEITFGKHEDMFLDPYMAEISSLILQRKIKISLGIFTRISEKSVQALGRCLQNINRLSVDEQLLLPQAVIILREYVEKLAIPQELTINRKTVATWLNEWKIHAGHPQDKVLQILQLLLGKIKTLIIADVMTYEIMEGLIPHLNVLDEVEFGENGNNINLDQYMGRITQCILEREEEISLVIRTKIDIPSLRHISPTFKKLRSLTIDEKYLPASTRAHLREDVYRLVPIGHVLKVNGLDSAIWVQKWFIYDWKPEDIIYRSLMWLACSAQTKAVAILTNLTDQIMETLTPLVTGVLHEIQFGNPETGADINLDRNMVSLSQWIRNRQRMIDIKLFTGLSAIGIHCLGKCLPRISELSIYEELLSPLCRSLLCEFVYKLSEPQQQALKINGISASIWSRPLEVLRTHSIKRAVHILSKKPNEKFFPAEKAKILFLMKKISDPIMEALAPHISTLAYINLGANTALDRYMDKISTLILRRKTKIDLAISYKINRTSAMWLGRCLPKVNNLIIYDHTMSPECYGVLSKYVLQLAKPEDLMINRINGILWTKKRSGKGNQPSGVLWTNVWDEYGDKTSQEFVQKLKHHSLTDMKSVLSIMDTYGK